mmetsp:Transcript_14147/g.21732  ORF Transcript_14147/g.21732 Transcript_14147/m.21732 type:complete len:224 (+) Transcript_14147:901-1572(+)
MLQRDGSVHKVCKLGSFKYHFKMHRLTGICDVQYTVGLFAIFQLHAVLDRRQICRGVIEATIRLSHEHGQGRAIPVGIPIQKHRRRAIAFYCQSLPLQFFNDIIEVRIVKRFTTLLQTLNVQRAVNLLVLNTARRAQAFPRRQRLRIPRLKFDDALSCTNFKIFIDVEAFLGCLVELHEITEIDVPRCFCTQGFRILRAQMFHEHTKLRTPISHMIQTLDIMP